MEKAENENPVRGLDGASPGGAEGGAAQRQNSDSAPRSLSATRLAKRKFREVRNRAENSGLVCRATRTVWLARPLLFQAPQLPQGGAVLPSLVLFHLFGNLLPGSAPAKIQKIILPHNDNDSDAKRRNKL